MNKPAEEHRYHRLLREWQQRARTMGRDTASHDATLLRVMADLDAKGPSEAGDCIQSLVFELMLASNRDAHRSKYCRILEAALSEVVHWQDSYCDGRDQDEEEQAWKEARRVLALSPCGNGL